ncbi:MAG: YraN family protein [Leifsonia sp.]
MITRIELGRRGEELAADYLTSIGYRVIDRNWRCRDGEIDVIAEEGRETVFVEVKTRSSTAYGHPFEAITLGKMRRMRRLAAAWCEAAGGPGRRLIRIDAIAVIAPRDGRPTIEHLQRLS